VRLDTGRLISHYRLVERLGEGGMGVVWKALDTTLAREVALKLLPPSLSGDPEHLEMFERKRVRWPRSIIRTSSPCSRWRRPKAIAS